MVALPQTTSPSNTNHPMLTALAVGGEETTMTESSATMNTYPLSAGAYLIIDPCYAMSRESWEKLGSSFDFDARGGLVRHAVTGL
jgi:hypothetical protein